MLYLEGFEFLSRISDKLGRSEGTYTEGDYLAVYNQVCLALYRLKEMQTNC